MFASSAILIELVCECCVQNLHYELREIAWEVVFEAIYSRLEPRHRVHPAPPTSTTRNATIFRAALKVSFAL